MRVPYYLGDLKRDPNSENDPYATYIYIHTHTYIVRYSNIPEVAKPEVAATAGRAKRSNGRREPRRLVEPAAGAA